MILYQTHQYYTNQGLNCVAINLIKTINYSSLFRINKFLKLKSSMNAYRQSLIESQFPDSLQKLKISTKKIKSLIQTDPYQNLNDLVTIKNINHEISKKRTLQNSFKGSRLARMRKQQNLLKIQEQMVVMSKKLSNSEHLSKIDLSQKYVLKIKRGGYKFYKELNQRKFLQTTSNQNPSKFQHYLKYNTNAQVQNPQMRLNYSPEAKFHNNSDQPRRIITLSKQSLNQKVDVVKKQRIKTLPKIKISQTPSKVQKNNKNNKPIFSYFDLPALKMKSECFFMLQCDLKQHTAQNKYIISNNGNKSVQIASLTKIMTFYAVWNIIKKYDRSLEQNVIISEEIQDFPGTSAHLYQGEIYTIQQLLYGLMLPSGNDAAISLAKWGGQILRGQKQGQTKIRYFVNYMNKLARQLQLTQTNFDNPHGLSNPRNRSSCRDVARLCSICLKISLFLKICSTQYYKCKISRLNCKKKQYRQWDNTNKLLRRPNFLGIKTGITVTAGPCLASAYTFRQKVYITVLLRCNKISRRFKQTRYLLVHTLKKLYQNQLTLDEQKQLKRLQKNNEQLDSDYSEQEKQFNFSKNDGRQFKKRIKILTES